MPTALKIEHRKRRHLYKLLTYATELVDDFSDTMSTDQYQWQRTILGHNFSVSRTSGQCNGENCSNIMNVFRSWLYGHEDAQVMLASVLVVIGLWWLVRLVLNLLINLVCPLLVVLLAVMCVPQLRSPLLGQNYPAVANLLRNILLKMAENIKTQ
ncbi:uncharacterized protein LOC135076546 [Ostrinia nubilalis]|uniref:uncharacterized protein LOC114353771 n=1 Tax=Ostrinia furnacalis TaxID=93504 RepID=UPI00103F61DE|nr:uncharacterized protein LOC114353771 [Ostrinia furnacalis]